MEHCQFCGKEIPQATIKARHYTLARLARGISCNRTCDIERRKSEGLYKAMSLKGTAARSVAVATSNRENPRRKQKVSV